MTDAQELLRLRDKVHAIEKGLWGEQELGRQLARIQGELRDRISLLEERIEAMTEADKIATAVTSALSSERRLWFNGWRRLAAAAAGALLLVPAAHDLVGWLGI